MDKVESFDGRYSFKRSDRKRTGEKKGPLQPRFSSLLEPVGGGEFSPEESYEDRDGSLEQSLDAVHQEGERLRTAPTLENIRKYKTAVRSFLKRVLKGMITVEEQSSGLNILKRKRFTQIRIIDEKLERLAAEVLENQSRQMALLDRVNEINGLLVDLLT